MMREPVLFVGIGSAHGDDQVGWAFADLIASQAGICLEVRKAHEPAELLNWLDGIEKLHICDACVTDAPAGELATWRFPSAAIEETGFASTHAISLPAVLRLSEQLGILPREVVIWGVTITCAAPGESLSPPVEAVVQRVADRICAVLCHA